MSSDEAFIADAVAVLGTDEVTASSPSNPVDVRDVNPPQTDALTNAQLRASPVPTQPSGTQTVTDAQAAGTWGYNAGTAGTLVLTGSKRVLHITAIALEAAATLTINGGDTITIPYGATDSVSSELTIEPRGNLTDPTLVFTGTTAYFVEYVS